MILPHGIYCSSHKTRHKSIVNSLPVHTVPRCQPRAVKQDLRQELSSFMTLLLDLLLPPRALQTPMGHAEGKLVRLLDTCCWEEEPRIQTVEEEKKRRELWLRRDQSLLSVCTRSAGLCESRVSFPQSAWSECSQKHWDIKKGYCCLIVSVHGRSKEAARKWQRKRTAWRAPFVTTSAQTCASVEQDLKVGVQAQGRLKGLVWMLNASPRKEFFISCTGILDKALGNWDLSGIWSSLRTRVLRRCFEWGHCFNRERGSDWDFPQRH